MLDRQRSAVIVLLSFVAPALSINYTTIVSPNSTYGTWEGWGTSLCWWAKAFGQNDDAAEAMFSLNPEAWRLGNDTLPGLGLNIVRYNAGATSTVALANGDKMQVSPNVSPTRLVDTFWLDYGSNSTDWDWTRDPNQRAMLQKAQARGANIFQLFSNSPVWWMCYNHNPSGSAVGVTDNLQSWNYAQHAKYLVEVADRAKRYWNITFGSVEAFNEPISSWWTATGTQEGCHFDVSTQATVIGLLRTALDNKGLQDVGIAASDENTYTEALSTWQGLGEAARGAVAQVQTHGYEYRHGRRDLLYQAVVTKAKKRLWNSEYAEADASGMELAQNLNLDFQYLHPTAWVYWQVMDGGGWGLISADNYKGETEHANAKYFVLAHYSRHIRPGFDIIDGGEANTVAAYDAASGVLVLVTTNYGNAQWINYDLSRFKTCKGPIKRWETNTAAGGARYVEHRDTTVAGGLSFKMHFESNTVMTFEIRGVVRV